MYIVTVAAIVDCCNYWSTNTLFINITITMVTRVTFVIMGDASLWN